MTSSTVRQLRVAVIGAGVSGLSAAKRLEAEGLKVTVYERQPGPGGVWKFTENASELFASPVYGSLVTNFPKQLMEFADKPWDDSVPMFPKRDAVEKYLRKYSKGVNVEYGTEVVRVHHRSPRQPTEWKLITRRVKSGKETTRYFEFIVVATGAFDRPFVPRYKGMRTWLKAHPNSMSHSNTYRDAGDFQGKRVVVVGNSASGWDLSAQLASTAKKVWVASTRSVPRSHRKAIAVKEIERLVPEERRIEFEGGTVAERVDHIIFCTGYLYSSTFLKKNGKTSEPLFPEGFLVDDLYEHIFWTGRATLAFVGIPKESPTWLVSQAQSAIVARAFSRRIGYLPILTDMAGWVKDERSKWNKKRKRGEAGKTSFHSLRYPACKDYIDGLERWCLAQDERAREGAPEGNKPFRWSDRLDWVMRNRREIREAFEKRKSDGQIYPTPESLGLSPNC